MTTSRALGVIADGLARRCLPSPWPRMTVRSTRAHANQGQRSLVACIVMAAASNGPTVVPPTPPIPSPPSLCMKALCLPAQASIASRARICRNRRTCISAGASFVTQVARTGRIADSYPTRKPWAVSSCFRGGCLRRRFISRRASSATMAASSGRGCPMRKGRITNRARSDRAVSSRSPSTRASSMLGVMIAAMCSGLTARHGLTAARLATTRKPTRSPATKAACMSPHGPADASFALKRWAAGPTSVVSARNGRSWA